MSYPPPNQPGYPPTSYGQAQPQPTGNYYPPPYPQPSQPSGHPSPATAYAAQPQPVITQPTARQEQGQFSDGWMAIPAQVHYNLPPSLQYLATLDQLMVKHETEFFEVFVGWETNNRYTIKNTTGQNLFFAIEINDWFTRMCCGTLRSFEIKVLDNFGDEVIRIQRDFKCNLCCLPYCLQKVEVFSPPNVLVGTVEQRWSLCTPVFDINNENGHTVLKIEGPICRFSLICGDIEFKVFSPDKSDVVGKIAKKWSGLLKEFFTDEDYFGITFPLDLDVRMKAVMIGACFLIDFMYFESTASPNFYFY